MNHRSDPFKQHFQSKKKEHGNKGSQKINISCCRLVDESELFTVTPLETQEIAEAESWAKYKLLKELLSQAAAVEETGQMLPILKDGPDLKN